VPIEEDRCRLPEKRASAALQPLPEPLRGGAGEREPDAAM
jgi:hypothetical protein